jgi:hypothetical protein
MTLAIITKNDEINLIKLIVYPNFLLKKLLIDKLVFLDDFLSLYQFIIF